MSSQPPGFARPSEHVAGLDQGESRYRPTSGQADVRVGRPGGVPRDASLVSVVRSRGFDPRPRHLVITRLITRPSEGLSTGPDSAWLSQALFRTRTGDPLLTMEVLYQLS
jgi:hypothetical protein